MIRLPNNKAVKDLLEGMLGKEVSLTAATKLSPVDGVGGLLATYCDDAFKIKAVVAWSAEAASYVGSALALIPPVVAKEMAAERNIREDVIENLTEVCNVMSSLFDHPTNPHVRMSGTYFPTAKAPQALAIFVFQHADRIDFELSVEGYGVGRLSVVSVG